ncbi:hypothetical protein RchiOBHm_Chr5g0004441 [Rosa chinensis]|uniref:Uncharacterized protein n=1 Tax=Rosa chinensis TaxID=74649 RepID=A0A2P6Q310_ROSCH|nr:hypothetical protein RchiOBHm_Chr5g0004441 [Rosa chinensis]
MHLREFGKPLSSRTRELLENALQVLGKSSSTCLSVLCTISTSLIMIFVFCFVAVLGEDDDLPQFNSNVVN